MRHIRTRDESLIRSVKKYKRAVFIRPIDIHFELRFCQSRTCRVVRAAEIQYVYIVGRNVRHKAVRSICDEICQTVKSARTGVELSRAACHYVSIYINRIYRIGDRNLIVASEYVTYVSGVALRAVRYEHFVSVYFYASLCIFARDGISEEIISLLRAVPAEAGAHAHFLNSRFHSLDNGRRERTCDVADAEADQFLVGVLRCIRIYSAGNLREKIASLEFSVIIVNFNHILFSLHIVAFAI